MLFGFALPLAAWGSPLDEAIALVLAESTAVRAAQREVVTLARQSNWTGRVRLGYSAKGTSLEPDGANAALIVEIPLDSRKRELAAVKARGVVAGARDRVLKAFLADVERLSALAVAETRTAELTALTRDRLLYFKQGVDEGRFEPDTLWPHAEAAKQTEHDYRAAVAKRETALATTARYFGGHQWKRLRDLLAANAKPSKP